MLERLVVLCAVPIGVVSAQVAPPTGVLPPPSIQVTAQSEVKVAPDRAMIRISVQTRGETAAEAVTLNASKQTSVISALRKLGIPNERLSTADYNVNPNYRYEPNRDPIPAGYIVTNTIIAELHDLTKVGAVIDAAVSNGANMISSLEFYAANTDSARQSALAAAIRKARADAAIAARAAGGSLGRLLELSTSGQSVPPPYPIPMYGKTMDAASAPPTPINPGQQSIFVSVFTRWEFTASQ
jgi:uncharacterized protein YggE